MELPKLHQCFGWEAHYDALPTKFPFTILQLQSFFSIVLMALVDADYHFIYIDMGNYGSNGDSSIFKNSALGEAFTGKLLNIPGPKRLPGYPEGGALPHCIVADEAFPLRMDLM